MNTPTNRHVMPLLSPNRMRLLVALSPRSALSLAFSASYKSLIFILFISGCAQNIPSPPTDDESALTAPTIVLTKPLDKQVFKKNDPFELEGTIIVRKGNWSPAPSAFELTISKDKTGKDVGLSMVLQLTQNGPSGPYSFAMKRKADWGVGKFYVRLGMYKSGDNTRVDQPFAELRQIEVRPK